MGKGDRNGFSGGRSDRVQARGPVGADEAFGAIDHHLRRVDTVLAEVPSIFALPLCGGIQRIRVFPAKAVPIGDVKSQRQDVGALPSEVGQERVRRRT
jgi:hypothetical protein